MLAISVSLAMILSFVESQIPPLAAVPGVKLGIANIVTVFLLYSLSPLDAGAVSGVRVVLSALLFGSAVSLAYSAAGALLSFFSMLLAKRLLPLSSVGVSVIGAVMHNVGQVCVAMLIMESAAIAAFLAPLLISGTLAGIVIGLLGGICASRANIIVNGK
jgi:heptaprenyl diphosphate synthase